MEWGWSTHLYNKSTQNIARNDRSQFVSFLGGLISSHGKLSWTWAAMVKVKLLSDKCRVFIMMKAYPCWICLYGIQINVTHGQTHTMLLCTIIPRPTDANLNLTVYSGLNPELTANNANCSCWFKSILFAFLKYSEESAFSFKLNNE